MSKDFEYNGEYYTLTPMTAPGCFGCAFTNAVEHCLHHPADCTGHIVIPYKESRNAGYQLVE